MTNEEKTEKIANSLQGQDLYTIKSVDNVNYTPHMYMVGPKHIEHSPGVYLDIEAAEKKGARCCEKGCSLPYESHTSDNVAFLQLLRNGTNDEANIIMKKLVSDIGEKIIDGFAFVETEEKFRTNA